MCWTNIFQVIYQIKIIKSVKPSNKYVDFTEPGCGLQNFPHSRMRTSRDNRYILSLLYYKGMLNIFKLAGRIDILTNFKLIIHPYSADGVT